MSEYGCGGCRGLGSHVRGRPEKVGRRAALFGMASERAESIGDEIGGNDPGLANVAYQLGSRLRAVALNAAQEHHNRPLSDEPGQNEQPPAPDSGEAASEETS